MSRFPPSRRLTRLDSSATAYDRLSRFPSSRRDTWRLRASRRSIASALTLDLSLGVARRRPDGFDSDMSRCVLVNWCVQQCVRRGRSGHPRVSVWTVCPLGCCWCGVVAYAVKLLVSCLVEPDDGRGAVASSATATPRRCSLRARRHWTDPTTKTKRYKVRNKVLPVPGCFPFCCSDVAAPRARMKLNGRRSVR